MNKNKIVAIATASVLLVGTSCKKSFFDINHNPNTATESLVTPDLILPNTLYSVGALTGANASLRPIYMWMGHWSPSGSFAPSTEESTYNITNTFGTGIWNGFYNTLFDLKELERKSAASGLSFHRAASLISQAILWQQLVDVYGDIPYSQALDVANFPAPAYDKAEDIYKDLQVKLDTAINLMKNYTVAAKSNIPSLDVIFQGNTTKWVKLANTVKLRLLIRQSQVNANPAAELAKVAANPLLGAGETAQVTLDFTNVAGKQNPFFALYGKKPDGNDANDYSRANTFIVNILKNTNDPRLNLFFKAPSAGGAVTGTTYGASTSANPDGTHSSNIGAGLAKSFSQPQWILTSTEALFLQAEAIARGWLPGDAKAVYESAVRESFTWLGVANPVTAADTYMANNAVADWANAGATADSKAKFIVYQKYIALTGIAPMEVWSDYRRLGVPASNAFLSVNPDRGTNPIPVRLLYPQSEFSVNSANVPKGINQFTSAIFWDK